MHRRLGLLIAAVAVALINSFPAKADVQDFTIESFEANYLITKDTDDVSAAYVLEIITATFPDFDQNHGILRALPESYLGHSLEVTVDYVTDEQRTPIRYETYSENGNKVIKIGDPDAYVHGRKKYVIGYHMRGVINKTDERDEFYWNINGTQWQQPIGKVLVYVRVDDPVYGAVPASAILEEKFCYTGVAGSTASDCTITDEDGFKFETTRSFNPGENLTVAMGFAKDTFAAYKPSPALVLFWVGVALGIIVPPLIALWVVLRNWRRYGRDPKGKGVVVPEYLPPKHESVLTSSMVLQEGFNVKSVTAALLDLAVRHHIKIYEVKDNPNAKKPSDYELELIKPVGLKSEEQSVVDMFFGETAAGSARVKLSSKKAKMTGQLAKLGKDLDKQVTDQGYFARSPNKSRRPYIVWGVVLLALSFIGWPYTAGVSVAGVLLLIAGPAMPARSQKGVDLRNYLFGVRDYIKLAETERLKVLQSPHGMLTAKINIDDKRQLIKLYERLLPYAVLFGLEKDWAKVLQPLYETEPPTWYGGHGTFHAAYFASSVGSFSTASATAFAPPSGSGGSGFSGGGSGGGGGGGGGGGW